jgi:acyl carrier protein
MYSDPIKTILAEHGRLHVDVGSLTDDSDLYEAGLTSLSTVNLMLALEERFNVEFLDRMLGRKTFGSIRSLAEAIEELAGPSPALAAPASSSLAARA